MRHHRFALALALLLLRAGPLAAQAYTVAPPPYQTVLDNNGAKVSNACVWTYAAGTTTPVATYSDVTGTVNTNPIRTDPAGRFTAYLVPGTGYKFVYELPCAPPAHGVVLRTADNISGTPSVPAVVTGTWLPSVGGTATYSSREGTYVRIGALVYARGSFTLTTLGTGAVNLVQGLPFPTAGAAAVTVGNFGPLATPIVWVGGYVPTGDTQMVLIGLTAAGTTTAFLSLFGNGASLTFSLIYQTAAP